MNVPDQQILGERLLQRVGASSHARWLLSLGGLALLGALTVSTVWSNEHTVFDSNVAVSSSSEDVVDPEVGDGACDNATVRRQVEDALRDPDETLLNQQLAFPSEVPPADRARQSTAWHALSASEREYQLCLRLASEVSTGSP